MVDDQSPPPALPAAPAIPPFERLSLEDGFHYFTAETNPHMPGKAVLSLHGRKHTVLWVAAVAVADPTSVLDLDQDGPTTFDKFPADLLVPALALAQALEDGDYEANERALWAEFPNVDDLLDRIPGQWTCTSTGACGTSELTGSSSGPDSAGTMLSAIEQAIGPNHPAPSTLSVDLDRLDLHATVRGTGVYRLLAWARAHPSEAIDPAPAPGMTAALHPAHPVGVPQAEHRHARIAGQGPDMCFNLVVDGGSIATVGVPDAVETTTLCVERAGTPGQPVVGLEFHHDGAITVGHWAEGDYWRKSLHVAASVDSMEAEQ